MNDFTHTTVLLQETVNALVLSDLKCDLSQQSPAQHRSGVYLDGTFGRGGHSRALLRHLSPDARLIVFDKDPQAIACARQLAQEDARVHVIHDGFATMARHLQQLGIPHVNGVMLDLGVSSPQLDDASRGFSFMREGPLDMRMNTEVGITAQQWLAQASVNEMTEVFKRYGEERFAFNIAKAIDSRRQEQPLSTTLELAELIANSVKFHEKGKHPATRTFQAIRIYLNQELQELSDALSSMLEILAPQGRMAVISFHSLEDRMVKQFIAQQANPASELARLPFRESELPQAKIRKLGKIKATAQEVQCNVRSRSAILRIAQRTEVE